MKISSTILSILIISRVVCSAQSQAGAGETARIRVIALGVVPELVPELQNGVMGFAKEPPGARPSLEAELWAGDKSVARLPLSLNSLSEQMDVKAGAEVEIRVPESGNPGTERVLRPYLKIPAANARDRVVFFTKPTPKDNWITTPKAWVFDDSVEAFPLRGIRLVNLSDRPVFHIVGEEKIQVLPGKQVIVPASDEVVRLRVAVSHEGKAYPILNTARTLDASERLVIATINWDGPSQNGPARPAAAMLVHVPAPAGPR